MGMNLEIEASLGVRVSKSLPRRKKKKTEPPKSAVGLFMHGKE